jgi:hypothetical protein
MPAPFGHRIHLRWPAHRVAPGIVAALALSALVSTGCGSSSDSGAQGTLPGSTTTTRAAGRHLTGPSAATIRQSTQVVVGGKEVAVPTEIGTTPIAPQIDDGQQIIISAAGLLPARLFSDPKIPVTWTNLTDQPQQVIFDYLPVKSPVIAPGGTFSYTSLSSESIAYHTASGLHGVDTVNPPFA